MWYHVNKHFFSWNFENAVWQGSYFILKTRLGFWCHVLQESNPPTPTLKSEMKFDETYRFLKEADPNPGTNTQAGIVWVLLEIFSGVASG